MAVFADALKPEKFSGVHFKRWQMKCTLWLEAMHVFWVSKGKPEGDLSDADLQRFTEANTLFRGAILSALIDRLVDVYMHIKDGKELWDALEAKFGASDAGSDLYIMESFHDFKMVNDKSIVQQAHDIQCIAKELEILKCSLPDPFVAGCIIAKLPSSWRSFATVLKHKRTKISVEELIASLDMEEKARAKDTKGGEGHSVANTVQNQRNQGKGKGKFKPNKTTNFKKKKNKAELPCFTCGELGHFSKDCPERADRRGKRGGNGQSSQTVNTVTRDCSVLMGNGSTASVLGTGTVDLKFISGKIVQLKNVQHVPSMNKNLVSGSLLLRDGFKVVLESNKVVVSGHGLFIGKCYVSGGLFRLSLSDFSNKCVNHICGGVNDDASLWHGRLCHVNFGLMRQLSSMRLIPSFTFVKGSKCHSCVQSKQPRKPHKAAEPRNLAPLELIHSDLCEMNDMHSTSRFSSEITPELNAPTEAFEPPREISPEEDNNEAPRKSKRQRVEKSFGNDFIVYLVDDTPMSISEAYASSDADNWKEAVQSELDSILSNGTWELIEWPYGCKPVGCKWVFKKKLRPDGTIEKYKARLVAKDIDVINEVKSFLSTKFDMKDLGEADVILNIKLIKDESGITLSQTHYVEKVLSRFGYIDNKPSSTPYDPSVTLKKNKRIGVNQLKYSQIIGSLMYLASATRPDISFAVSKLSRFMSNPGTDHWHALERVMCYLKGTMSYGIHYSGHPAVLEGYSDANWISDDELYATSGYVFMLGGGAVSWRSCKQTILTRSTMEAELAALDTASVEADWLRELLMDLPVVEKPIPAILMNCDNRIAIAKVNGDKENAKSSRHVRRRVKSVGKMRHSGVISVTYIQTEKNWQIPLRRDYHFSPSRRRRASATGRAGLRNPSPFELLHREKANKVFGKRYARLLAVFTTGRPSSSAVGGYRRRLLHGLLHRAVYSTCDVRDTVIVNVIPSTESALAAD
ncbi:hypothetical protein U9M48_001204, partial [Paspalum notatum var. saurae]